VAGAAHARTYPKFVVQIYSVKDRAFDVGIADIHSKKHKNAPFLHFIK
jgi:hypothetical protein